MDLSDSFVILWLVVAGICIVPGLILTLVNQNRQKRPPALKLLSAEAFRCLCLSLHNTSYMLCLVDNLRMMTRPISVGIAAPH